MALYDLVSLRHALNNAMNADQTIQALADLRESIARIKLQVPVLPPEHAEYIDQVVAEYDRIITEVVKPINDYQTRLELINRQIHAITHQLFTNNYELEERTEIGRAHV